MRASFTQARQGVRYDAIGIAAFHPALNFVLIGHVASVRFLASASDSLANVDRILNLPKLHHPEASEKLANFFFAEPIALSV